MKHVAVKSDRLVDIVHLDCDVITTVNLYLHHLPSIRGGHVHGLRRNHKPKVCPHAKLEHLYTAPALINTLLSAGWTEMHICHEPLQRFSTVSKPLKRLGHARSLSHPA